MLYIYRIVMFHNFNDIMFMMYLYEITDLILDTHSIHLISISAVQCLHMSLHNDDNEVLFHMKETWEHVFLHWQQGKLWANCFMRWMPVLKRGPQNLRDTPHPHCCTQRLNHLAMTHPSENGLAQADWYHTLATTASRFWAGTIPHWAAYIWHL